MRELILGLQVLTLVLRILIFCERDNRSSKGANSRSEGADSRSKDTNFI